MRPHIDHGIFVLYIVQTNQVFVPYLGNNLRGVFKIKCERTYMVYYQMVQIVLLQNYHLM